ncbi:hypothetical protein GIB67_005432 [Kingdonia uniflora]|uniref:Uncharacterized protein n=1 Tax=Kingdonia uniflora TaxID=39325 RepID=A0A7J7NHT7_9MAGN|nr:hypothetical protein GIB67_005432 [Kingdonia uniflora]
MGSSETERSSPMVEKRLVRVFEQAMRSSSASVLCGGNEKVKHESKKMWSIAGPAILTAVTQFSIEFVTIGFVGHLGDVELASLCSSKCYRRLCLWNHDSLFGFRTFPRCMDRLLDIGFQVLVWFKLSFASAIMLCLELWYFTAIILLVGSLKNPEIAVDAVPICMSLQLWTLMIALGFSAAVSVRVSNELGDGNPKAARSAVVVAVFTSFMFGIFFTGVAVGADWHFLIAIVNGGCYYIIGLPFGTLNLEFRHWKLRSAPRRGVGHLKLIKVNLA